MSIAPKPENEEKRIRSLIELAILDTPPEEAFDKLTKLAASLCGTEMSAVSLIDRDRQWFKSRVGIDVSETSRDVAFCAHAILGDELLEIPDARADIRFKDNPSVLSHHIRFYAGVPLKDKQGLALGTLCVVDSSVKVLEDFQKETLKVLAKKIENLILRK